MTMKYAKYIHDAEMEKFILTRLFQFGGHQIRNSAIYNSSSSRKG